MPTIAQALASGLEHQRAGRLAQAEEIYRQVLRSQPQHAGALNLLAALAVRKGRPEEAVAMFEQAVAAEPDRSLYLGNLGSAYAMIGQHENARAALERAIRLDPTNADAHYNLGLAMERTDQVDEAVASYRRAVELQPRNRPAHNNLGALLRGQAKLDEALTHFDAALAVDPQAPHVHFNRAMLLLALGQLVEGWQEYEWRLQCREYVIRRLPQPVWDGAPLAEQTLLVHAEQGLGDMIQFLRYLPLVRARCRNVVVEVPAVVMHICHQSGIDGLIVQPAPVGGSYAAPRARYEVQIPLLSLPRVFRTTLSTIPADVPYLKVAETRVAAWQQKLSAEPGFKVGIAWQGRATHRDDRFRSFPLTLFSPLARISGVRLYSLQKGAGAEQIEALGGLFDLIDLQRAIDPDSDPLMEVAAILKNLDLVITCDTMIAHLAGALGVPVWMALATRVDWRWLLDRTDSPWYPTMRLFRQGKPGDWEHVFEEMAVELRTIVGRRGPSTMEL